MTTPSCSMPAHRASSSASTRGRRPTPGGSTRAVRSRASARRRDSPPRTAPAESSPTSAGRAVRDGRAALDLLADWLRARYGGARVLGVGHRVVHGGARTPVPTSSRRGAGGVADARAAGAAPSAVQPGRDRRGRRAASRRAAGRLLRHELSSWPAGRRRGRSAATGDPRAACSATASTGCRTNTLPRSCHESRRRSPAAA